MMTKPFRAEPTEPETETKTNNRGRVLVLNIARKAEKGDPIMVELAIEGYISRQTGAGSGAFGREPCRR